MTEKTGPPEPKEAVLNLEPAMSTIGMDPFHNRWRIKNPPPDKQLTWCTHEDQEKGDYLDHWDIYTPRHLAEDKKKFGTALSARPRIDGEYICVAKHFLVFQPMNVWLAIQERKARMRELRKHGSIPDGASGRMKVKNGRGNIVLDHVVKAGQQ